jgi:paraquat-inducible protein A
VHTYNQPATDASLVACPDCDLLQRVPAMPPGGSAHCPRCDCEIARNPTDFLNRTLALTVAAAVLFIAANTTPMLGLSAVGHEALTTVLGGALHLWQNDEQVVAILVLATAVIAPGLQIGLLLAILLGSMRERPPAWVGRLLRHHPDTCVWSMIEVMMLGVLVALIKIAAYAKVVTGPALYMLGALIFLLAGTQATLDRRQLWARVTWAREGARFGKLPEMPRSVRSTP